MQRRGSCTDRQKSCRALCYQSPETRHCYQSLDRAVLISPAARATGAHGAEHRVTTRWTRHPASCAAGWPREPQRASVAAGWSCKPVADERATRLVGSCSAGWRLPSSCASGIGWLTFAIPAGSRSRAPCSRQARVEWKRSRSYEYLIEYIITSASTT